MTKQNEAPMDSLALALLVLGALAGGFVSGLAGFGTALAALGIWLYVLPPSLAVPLVVICSIVGQSSTLPEIWRFIDFKLVWPFLIGGLAGVPLGTMLVAHADPIIFKLIVGVLRPGRVCGRHPWRPRRAVRPAANVVGEHAGLGQG